MDKSLIFIPYYLILYGFYETYIMLHNVYLWLFIASVMASCDHLHQPKDHPISASPEKIMPQNGFIWSLIQEENPWKKNYNFHMFEFQDSLWILQNSQTFVSANGVHWRESKHFNHIGNQAFLDIIIHQEFHNFISLRTSAGINNPGA